LRRESVLFGLFVIILLVKVDNSRQFQTWRSRKRKNFHLFAVILTEKN